MTPHDRSVVVFDVETTGLRPDFDQIIELSIQRGLGPESSRWTKRFKPTVPISPGAQERHGISLDALANCPSFSEHALEIRTVFNEAEVIAGYNVQFDLAMLGHELKRAKSPIDLTDKVVIDAYRLWQAREPRRLEDAVLRFIGQKHEAAHSADGDVVATALVLGRMLDAFGLSGLSWDEIADIRPQEERCWIGPSSHFQWQDDQPILAFGKHKGSLLFNVSSKYLQWMSDNDDFPEHVKQICKMFDWLGSEMEFLNWLKQFSPLPKVKGGERNAMKRQAQEQFVQWEAKKKKEKMDPLVKAMEQFRLTENSIGTR